MISYYYYLISGLCYHAKSKSDCGRFSVRFIFPHGIIRAHGIIEINIYMFFFPKKGPDGDVWLIHFSLHSSVLLF